MEQMLLRCYNQKNSCVVLDNSKCAILENAQVCCSRHNTNNSTYQHKKHIIAWPLYRVPGCHLPTSFGLAHALYIQTSSIHRYVSNKITIMFIGLTLHSGSASGYITWSESMVFAGILWRVRVRGTVKTRCQFVHGSELSLCKQRPFHSLERGCLDRQGSSHVGLGFAAWARMSDVEVWNKMKKWHYTIMDLSWGQYVVLWTHEQKVILTEALAPRSISTFLLMGPQNNILNSTQVHNCFIIWLSFIIIIIVN